jgi:L-rhamnonate dehydratase
MNRAFPGNPRASISYRIADFVNRQVFPRAKRKDALSPSGVNIQHHAHVPPDSRSGAACRDQVALLFDTPQAIQLVRAREPYRPVFIEELLHPEDYEGYRKVADAVDTLIACGEQEATEWGFRELIERAHIDVLQPDLSRCGGFTAARKIVHMAEMANVLVVPHSWSRSAHRGLAAFECFPAAGDVCRIQHVARPPQPRVGAEPSAARGGHVRVPQDPGLGLEVDEDAVERYRIA